MSSVVAARTRALAVGGALLLATAAAAYYAASWPSDNRASVWLNAGSAAAVDAYGLLNQEFGGDDTLVLRADGFRGDDAAALQWLAQLGPRLENLAAVDGSVDPWRLPGAPPGAEALAAAAARPLGRALKMAAAEPPHVDLLVGVQGDSNQTERNELAAAVRALQEEGRARDVRLRAAGHPLISAALDQESKRVERVFTPLLAAAAFAGVALALRSLALAAAALLPALFMTVAVQAGVRALGWPSNLVLVACGPLTFVLTLAGALHFIAAFRRQRALGRDAAAAAAAARAEKAVATALCTLTTASGFLSFALSPLQPVRRLGLAVAGGIALSLPLLLFVLPALLAGSDGAVKPLLPRAHSWRGSARWALRRRGLVLGAATLALAGGGWALLRLPVGTNALDYFPAGHSVRSEFESLEREGAILSTVEVLAAAEEGAWTPSALLAADFAASLAQAPGALAVLGPEVLLADLEQSFGAAAALVAGEGLRRGGRLSASGRWARWSVAVPTAEAGAIEGVVQELRAVADAWAEAHVVRVEVTGTIPLLMSMQAQVVGTLGRSLAFSLLVSAVLFLLVVRSRREFAAALVANLMPVAVALCAAWLFRWPLDAATVMVSAVVLGLAVDNTFHLLYAGGPPPRRLPQVLRAYDCVGEAAVVSSLALAAGFLMLAGSGFAPTARFGVLTAAGVLAALGGDMLVLPAIWGKPGVRSNLETISRPPRPGDRF